MVSPIIDQIAEERTDIAVGKRHGVTAVLVLSGETTEADVDAAAVADKPDYVFGSLDDVDKVIFG